MKTYTLEGPHLTAHAVCTELGIGKQTLVYWLRRHKVPCTQIVCGKKIAVTMIPVDEMVALRLLNRKRKSSRDHLPSEKGAA